MKIIEKLHTSLFSDLWFLKFEKFENSMISAWVGAPQNQTWKQTF